MQVLVYWGCGLSLCVQAVGSDGPGQVDILKSLLVTQLSM